MTINFRAIKESQLARNTLWAFCGQGARTIVLAGYFVLIARLLGAEGYGAFVGVLALVGILSPFSSLGSGNLLIKNVARTQAVFRSYWGNSLILVLLSGGLLSLIAVCLSVYLLPASIPLSLIVTIALAELLFARVHEICGQAYQAFQRLKRTALVLLSLNVARLVAVAGLGIFQKALTPQQWGFWYLFSTGVSTIFCVWLVNRELGFPLFRATRVFAEVKEGFYFSVSQSAQSIYNDIDKTMLARLSTLEAAGIYSAAYRIIDVSFTPVRSLLYASYARFFQHGTSGINGSLSFAAKLMPLSCGFSAVVCLILNITASLVPHLLGHQYQEVEPAIRMLSVIPLLRSLHYFAADTLTGAGLQGRRSLVQFAIAVFNVAANLWLIPLYGWRGAAMASLASDGLLALLLWVVVLCQYYKCKRKVQYA